MFSFYLKKNPKQQILLSNNKQSEELLKHLMRLESFVEAQLRTVYLLLWVFVELLVTGENNVLIFLSPLFIQLIQYKTFVIKKQPMVLVCFATAMLFCVFLV